MHVYERPAAAARDPKSASEVQLRALLQQRLGARAIELAATRRVFGSSAGPHLSRFRGRGVDYLESRVYQPGDDIRNMDWRVTARSGRPHTKLFQEERERSVLLAIDHNPSMRFGTRVRFKSVAAARAAAMLAWSAARGGDRVGSVGFGGGVNGEVRPGGAARGVLHNLRAWVEWDGIARSLDTVAPLSEGLLRTRRLARPGSLVLVLSDGFSADAAAAAPLARLAEHGDVVFVLVSDPLELKAPPPGRYAVLSGGTRRIFEFGGRGDAAWSDAFAARRDAYLGLARRFGVPVLRLETADEPARALADLGQAFGRRRASV